MNLQQVKVIIGGEAILKLLDYKSLDIIYHVTNVSLIGIKACIGQGPLMDSIQSFNFYARKLKLAEMNYSVTDKETLTVIDGLLHF